MKTPQEVEIRLGLIAMMPGGLISLPPSNGLREPEPDEMNKFFQGPNLS